VLRAGRFPSPGASEPSWSCRSLQSLFRQRRSEVIGFLAPGTSSARACAGPAGIPLTVRTVSLSGCRCLSPGIRFPFTVYPEYLARISSNASASRGVSIHAPSTFSDRELTSPVLSTGAPRLAPGLPPGPTPTGTASLAGFLNLSATCLSRVPPAIFRRVTLVGFYPSGVCSPERIPGSSSLPACPLDVLLRTQRGLPQARPRPYLGWRDVLFRLQGLRPRPGRPAFFD
jgi:hypothetical protein